MTDGSGSRLERSDSSDLGRRECVFTVPVVPTVPTGVSFDTSALSNNGITTEACMLKASAVDGHPWPSIS